MNINQQVIYLKEQLPAALATWQQSNGGKMTVGYLHAANPEVISALVAEFDKGIHSKQQPAKYPYIRTHSGHHFYYQAISQDAIEIDDIAQALSNICRFAGHLDDFYSVAQHSVLVSRLVPPELALEALLHDASEAYCQDIPAPLKALLPDYRDIEASVDNAIRSLFGLPLEHSPEVKLADLIMLATERRDLGIDDGDMWDILDGIAPTDEFAIHPLNPRQACQLFIARFNELWRIRVEQRRQEIFGDTTP